MARTFTAWAHRDGRLKTDIGNALASPKTHRELPHVLRADQAATLVTAPATTADGRRQAPAAQSHTPATAADRRDQMPPTKRKPQAMRASGTGHGPDSNRKPQPARGPEDKPEPQPTRGPEDKPEPQQARGTETGTEPEPERGPVTLRDIALLELLYAGGIRVSELCGLDVDDLDLSRRVVRVLGKGAKERTVPIGIPAQRAVETWLRAGRPHLAHAHSGAALLLGARGGRLNATTARQIVSAWAEAAGLPHTSPHDLRHSAATHMIDGGADLRSVQELLGHASLASTQIYTHVSQERVRRVYNQAHPRA